MTEREIILDWMRRMRDAMYHIETLKHREREDKARKEAERLNSLVTWKEKENDHE